MYTTGFSGSVPESGEEDVGDEEYDCAGRFDGAATCAGGFDGAEGVEVPTSDVLVSETDPEKSSMLSPTALAKVEYVSESYAFCAAALTMRATSVSTFACTENPSSLHG
jgi:hypothetical protein